MAISTTVAQRAIARAAFKGLLRAARKLDASGAVADVEVKSITAVLPDKVASVVAEATAGPLSTAHAVREGFRAAADAAMTARGPGGALVPLEKSLDAALSALALANKRAATASAAATTASSSIRIGQVVRHKTLGYRGVVVGCDASCKASPKWIEATGAARLPNGVSQPFYHVLVDVRDRPTPQISYVARDNLSVLSGSEGVPSSDLAVLHPLLPRYFDSFVARTGAYQPSTSVAKLAKASQRYSGAAFGVAAHPAAAASVLA